MFPAIFLVFLLLHIAFGLAIGFFILMFAIRQERWLRILGLVFGWLIITLSVLTMLITSFMAIRYPAGPMHQMMGQGKISSEYKGPCPHCED